MAENFSHHLALVSGWQPSCRSCLAAILGIGFFNCWRPFCVGVGKIVFLPTGFSWPAGGLDRRFWLLGFVLAPVWLQGRGRGTPKANTLPLRLKRRDKQWSFHRQMTMSVWLINKLLQTCNLGGRAGFYVFGYRIYGGRRLYGHFCG